MEYLLDPTQGRFTVQAFAQGLLSSFGHSPTFAIRGFTGELNFAPDAPAEASLRIVVQANSLSLMDKVSDKDRAEIEVQTQRDVLESATYPEIVYQSSAIKADKIADGWYRLQIMGELQLHGVRKPHEVDAQLRLLDAQARLSGQTMLSQAEYRIRKVSALGGLIQLRDQLRFDFELVGLAKGA